MPWATISNALGGCSAYQRLTNRGAASVLLSQNAWWSMANPLSLQKLRIVHPARRGAKSTHVQRMPEGMESRLRSAGMCRRDRIVLRGATRVNAGKDRERGGG